MAFLTNGILYKMTKEKATWIGGTHIYVYPSTLSESWYVKPLILFYLIIKCNLYYIFFVNSIIPESRITEVS